MNDWFSYPSGYSAALAEMPSLIGLYWIGLIVGGGLLLISTLTGSDTGGDAEVDFDPDMEGDVDIEADTDMETDAAVEGESVHSAEEALSLANWFSIRFLIYFAAMFGFTGIVLTYMSETGPTTILIIALAGGLLVGQIAHQVFRYLMRSSSDSATKLKDYLNKPARVTIAIKPPDRGEVAIQIGDNERFVAAVARREDDTFDVGQPVGVVGFRAGTAVVVSQKEHEFLNES
ncbi:MAG: hypothetical protein MI923_15810 [Phycisphaerales bacterium]|nr:hypothetical protein [Phycisphaerales bacterium]